MKYRTEKDSLGEVKVPADKYWGAQTQRSLQNFKIGNDLIPLEIIYAFAIQKKAAAISNITLNKLDKKIGKTILDVCDEIISGKLNDHFPLSVWQTGSGTQTNMNLNEVIANRANELLKGNEKRSSVKFVHPNDHCNLGQSSNDSFPTVVHIAIVQETYKKLIPALKIFKEVLEKKEIEFKDIIKIGRTHLQDATPISLGQEFSAFKSQIRNSILRVENSLKEIFFLAQGGTAVGTGLNSSNDFSKAFIKAIQVITNKPFKKSINQFESLSSHDSIVYFSGALNSTITACYKISNDIRLLASGPRCGIGELELPANEPGSSIMPGKVNPTQCEAMAQVCIYLLGNHFSISMAGSQGHMQLNANKTVIAYSIIQSINLLSDSINSFVKNCIKGIKPNKKRINENLENSLMLVTALNPIIGYDKSAEIAKKAFKENITLKESAKRLGYVKENEFSKFVDPKKMI